MPGTPLALTLPLVALLLAMGGATGYTAAAAGAGRLRREGRWGVRTPAASASDPAFDSANRVAAPVLAGAAGVGVVVAALLFVLKLPTAATVVVALIGVVAVLALAVAASVLGDRAARTVPVPARRPGSATGVPGASCGGCGCGTGGCAGLTRTTDTAAQA